MNGQSPRRGLMAAGNWVVDRVKIIDAYPGRERLANILSETVNNGGAAYNLLKDLSKLGAPFPLEGAGMLGDDPEGDQVLADCGRHGIHTGQLGRKPGVRTAYTDVMSEQATGIRTFFHCRGANAFFEKAHVDLKTSRARHFHLAYLLLLDKLDEVTPGGSTGAAELLAEARTMGFTTSADLVSAGGGRFKTVIPPALPHVDILFLNEYEAAELAGRNLKLKPDGMPEDWSAVRSLLNSILDFGIRSRVILHFPGGACTLDVRGEFQTQDSVNLPPDEITGTVGAGDAFAAGVLLGLHEGISMEIAMRQGVCAAAACIRHPSSSHGVLPLADCLELGRKFGFRKT